MNTKNLLSIRKELKTLADLGRARISQSFFKTGPGQYGAGDQFLGVSVPDTRRLVKTYAHLSLGEIEDLLQSPWHEERLLALFLLVHRFQRSKEERVRKEIVDFYLAHTDHVNNWDLVDSSAPQILGEWLIDRPKALLTKLTRSSLLWERRIAIVATLAFIRKREPEETFRLSKRLLADPHDLIHKAMGWMLREVGKYCGEEVLNPFLDDYHTRLPRTALRYAIERHSSVKKQRYLAKTSRVHH